MPISQNTALFSLLGTTYGGDGKSNFALPNLQGSVPMQAGQGPGLSLRDPANLLVRARRDFTALDFSPVGMLTTPGIQLLNCSGRGRVQRLVVDRHLPGEARVDREHGGVGAK